MPFKKPKKEELSELKKRVVPFVSILEKSLSQKVNEADTRTIINDLLAEIFGYNKYFDITAEFMIKNSYADYVIIINDKKHMVIEAKPITTKLNNNHVKQAVDYAAHEGIKWAILTNAIDWKVYRVTLGNKIEYDLFFEFSLNDLSEREITDMYFLTKNSIEKEMLEDYWKYRQALNPPTLLQILLSDDIINRMRKELRTKSGYNVTSDEVMELLITQIIRPEFVRKSIERNEVNETNEEFVLPDFDKLTPMVKDAISYMIKVNSPVSSKEIKSHLLSLGHDFNSLSPVIGSLNSKFSNHFIKGKDSKYYFSDEAYNELSKCFKK